MDAERQAGLVRRFHDAKRAEAGRQRAVKNQTRPAQAQPLVPVKQVVASELCCPGHGLCHSMPYVLFLMLSKPSKELPTFEGRVRWLSRFAARPTDPSIRVYALGRALIC
jgi:hypothetical protein